MIGLKNLKKGLAATLIAAMLINNCGASLTAKAAELDATDVVETTTEVATEEVTTEATSEVVASTSEEEVVTTSSSDAEVSASEEEEVVETETNKSIEDLLVEVDNTSSIEKGVKVNLNVPSNTVLTKIGGNSLTSFEASVELQAGEYTLSQPTREENKTRLESNVSLVVGEDDVKVSFEGNLVNGTVSDAIGNQVSFDASTNTISILNADKLEDVVEEEEEVEPEAPQAQPADYTIRYFINEVSDATLIHSESVEGVVGDSIDLDAIDLNAFKPSDSDEETWKDGVMQEGAATVVTADDTDVIDIVYVSEAVEVGNTSFVVKYYVDNLTEGNFLGSYEETANAGDVINYDLVDNNKFQPAGYGDGVIQTVVSSTTVAADGSSVVYILYAGSEVIETVVEKEVEVPVEVPVEVVKEVEVEKVVEVEVPVEVPVEVEKTVEVPVEHETVVEVPGPQTSSTTKEVVYVPSESEETIVPTPETSNNDPVPSETDSDEPVTPEDGGSTPQTGDNSPIIPIVVLMVSALGAAFILGKKDEEEI
jgi:hypothetical protein